MLFQINTNSLCSHRNILADRFSAKLSVDMVLEVISNLKINFRVRVYDPLVTLFAFLSQVFNSDTSCSNAVLSVIAARKAQGLSGCSSNTGSLCKAKARLPVALFSTLAKRSAIIEEKDWKHGFVKVVDGTGISMPDTAANRKVFPKRRSNPHGFPGARLVAMFSLSSGSLIDLAVGAMKGKGTGETSLLKTIWHNLKPGDTLLGDSLFSSFSILINAKTQGVHVISELRKSSSWRLKSKADEQVIEINKPQIQPVGVSQQEFTNWPKSIKVRIIKIRCAPKGFRPKTKYVLTTFIDKKEVTADDILQLYKKRWQVELNLRSIKTTLGMDILRGQSPEMVLKEIWVHMLAYNIIRAEIYATSMIKNLPQMTMSFKQTLRIIALTRVISSVLISSKDGNDLMNMTELIAARRVGNRPERYEPRAIKRRNKNFHHLNTTRAAARRRLLKKQK